MSLYSMVCGNNPLFGLYARILETAAPLPPVPRFRDTYTVLEGEMVRIVIFTRTGGGNRDECRSENAELTTHPLYLRDADAEFDSTYANFFFAIPDLFAERMLRLHRIFSRHPKGMTPQDKFARQMALLKNETVARVEFTQADIQEVSKIIVELMPDISAEPSSLEQRT